MRISLQIPNYSFPGGSQTFSDDMREIVIRADSAGFHSIWVMDHYFQIGPFGVIGPAEDDMHEAYSVLSWIAALTKNVKLGTLVTGAVYRQPGFLIKTVTSLDVLSKGRAYLGIGAGWFEREAIGLGFPFPPLKVRFEILEETLQIAKQMWLDNNSEYKGKHFHLKETLCHPQPLSNPHPPILIGGMGPQKTLRMVAQYADACNLFTGGGLGKVKEALRVLKGHCERLGRNYDDIEKTSLSSAFFDRQTPEDIINHIKELRALGIDNAIFNVRNPLEHNVLDLFRDEIIPAVTGL